jgi:hypothetical protein
MRAEMKQRSFLPAENLPKEASSEVSKIQLQQNRRIVKLRDERSYRTGNDWEQFNQAIQSFFSL